VKQEAKNRKARTRTAVRRSEPRRVRHGASRSGKGQPVATVDALAPDDAVLREFIADLYAAMAMMRLLRQEIATALSLTSAEYSVLLAVWYLERQGEMTVRAIADHLHVAAAYVTSEVARLVDKGLLIKRPHPADRRAVGVALTKSAREILLRLGPMLRDINAPLLKGVYYRDLVTVHRFLRSIIDHGYDAIRVAQSFARDREGRGQRRQ
jgi:DNA-binding MarR family transcriptional regulator